MNRQRRTRAFKENALLYDLFDYLPTNAISKPEETHITTVRVAGAGDTSYNGVYESIGYVGPDSTIVFKYDTTTDKYLFYSESEWRLGLAYDPPDEDFAYGSDMTDDIWGSWYANTAVGAPTVFVDSIKGKKGGFGWGSNIWDLTSTCFDFGVKTEALTYTKNSIDLKVGPKHLFSKLSPSAWPDVEPIRDLDYKYMPNRLLQSNKLGKNGTTLYMAYVVQPISSIPAGRWFGMKHDATYGWFGRNYNQSNWGMEQKYGGGGWNSSVAITADITHLIVQKQEWKADGSKVLGSLWVDPTPAVHPQQADPVESADINGVDMTAWTFNRIYIAFSQVAKFGSYRLGENYYSVAPGKQGLAS